MRMLVLAVITAIGAAALVGPANAQSTRPPVTPPRQLRNPHSSPGGWPARRDVSGCRPITIG